jgi:carbamoyltransferase
MTNKNDPFVLGISASPHNGSVCLLKGDEIVVAIQEERLIRRKRAPLYGARPSLAIEYCLDYAGIRPSDLNMIVCCVTNHAKTPDQDVTLNPILQPKRYNIPVLYLPHHSGHAISAFATSGLKESAVLVVDGAGSPLEDLTEEEKRVVKWKAQGGLESISLYAASGASVKPLEKHLLEHSTWLEAEGDGMPMFWSLGGMYSAVAYQIFGDALEAGKVMGLAPYGKPQIPTSEFFQIDDGRLIFSDKVPRRFNHADRWPLRQKKYSDLACSTQAALEEAVLYLVNHLYDLCPSENLCYAGGVALNCITNERIIHESPFKNVYIAPAAEDSGTSIGAAYYGLWQLTKNNTGKVLLHDAVGPIYSEQQINDAIRDTAAIEVTDSDDVIADTVDFLCEGRIVGWFEGRSELGPRALGQRSILCDPRRPDAKDVLNNRVKHREGFRPFAPVVLLENVRDWFDLGGARPESPFMLRICKFNDDKKMWVPGVVHVDDTGRLQTVTPEANGRLYQVVKKFYEKTGVPIILNTSFNVAGEPIVETPIDALKTFLSTGIDYCFLENKIVSKRREILFETNETPWPQRIKERLSEVLTSVVDAKKKRTAGMTAASNQERALGSYAGTFENDVHGAIKIEQEDRRLKLTLISGLASMYYGGVSSSLIQYHHDVFVVAAGPYAGTKVAFLPDMRGRINILAIVLQEYRLISEAYFRTPETNVFDLDFYRRFIGEYVDRDKTMVVDLCDGKLVASAQGHHWFELLPITGTEFTLNKLPGYAIEFKTNGSGSVATAIVTQPNNVLVLEKSR